MAHARSALKFALDFGPLLVFFVTYKFAGLMAATAAIMAATLVSLLAQYLLERKLAAAPLLTALVVGVFGGLTLALDDATFVKLKPTIINVLFAIILFVGLVIYKRGLLKHLLGAALTLDDEAWRSLSRRWAFFFLFLAAMNEVVWRNFSEALWVNYRVFGIPGMTFVFMLTQLPFLMKHHKEESAEEN